MDEAKHRLFERFFVHLTMGNGDAHARHESHNAIEVFLELFDAVVQKIDLPAASEFLFDSLRDDGVGNLGDLRMDRQSVVGGRFDNRNVFDSAEAHLERARNGGCGHREAVDALGEGFDLFFMGDAKSVFFVDDEKPQVFENDVFRQNAMRTDEDVGLPDFEIGEYLLDFFWLSESVERFDGDGMAVESLEEVFVMLFGQDSRRNEYGDLFPIEHGSHGGSHGDFSFSESDVAANESFHGARRVHVVEHGFDGFRLIGGFFVGETRLESRKKWIAFGESKPRAAHALRIEIDEVDGEFFDVLTDFFFCSFPSATAEFIELLRAIGTGIFLHAFDALNGDVELSRFCVCDEEKIADNAPDFERDEPLILPNAVVFVHDVIADLEIFERGEGVILGLLFRLLRRLYTEEIGIGDDGGV